MIIYTFDNGDTLNKRDSAVIASFAGKRSVLSTAPHNGGCRETLRNVFNHGSEKDDMKAPTYEGHIIEIAKELGLDYRYTCGMSTGADVENTVIKSETFDGLTVTAAVTGGIDINAGRVGDTAMWNERNGIFSHVSGTINIMLFINVNLSAGAMPRALVTCTEAKTAAIQELLVPSRYSKGLATGSGTDGTIIIADTESDIMLTDAGKHNKLGELIGKTVMRAVKEALYLQTGLCAERQFNIFRRTDRIGITAENTSVPTEIASKPELVIYTSLYIHLIDQVMWGLISEQDAVIAAGNLLKLMQMKPERLDEINTDIIDKMIYAFRKGLLYDIK
ncbi:MAG: adenosylcobinamide amidohydrolase [Eubacteriales bacterium]